MTMARTMLALAVCGAAFAAMPAVAQDDQDDIAPPQAAPAPLASPTPNDDAAARKPAPQERPILEGKATDNPGDSKPQELGAAESKPDESRYTFSRMHDGYVRLDNRTGQVSFCSKRTVGWTCQLAPEDRGVLENEIARVQEENAILKKELLGRGLPLPGPVKPDPPIARGDRPFSLPADPTIDRMKVFVEKVWRRLVDMISTLQKDVLKKS
jgi:hypothetical protein